MASIDLQDRAKYLLLALFAQRVTSALMRYADENQQDQLRGVLEDALAAVFRAKDLVQSPTTRPIFDSYEQLRTIEEAWSSGERETASRLILALLRAPNSQKSKSSANQLIDLFSKLQRQALWNFEQPKSVSPRVLQRLCQLS